MIVVFTSRPISRDRSVGYLRRYAEVSWTALIRLCSGLSEMMRSWKNADEWDVTCGLVVPGVAGLIVSEELLSYPRSDDRAAGL